MDPYNSSRPTQPLTNWPSKCYLTTPCFNVAETNMEEREPGHRQRSDPGPPALLYREIQPAQCIGTMPWAIEPDSTGHTQPLISWGSEWQPVPKVLLVLTGERGRWRVLRSMVQSGVQLFVYNPKVNWAQAYLPPEAWITGPFNNPEEALHRVRNFLGDTTLNAVLSYDEFGVELASQMAEELGLPPGAPSSLLGRLRNKYHFRCSCRDAGLPSPAFMLLPGSFDAAARLQFERSGIGFPVVMKPVKGAGSCCVRKADSIQQLQGFVAEYQAQLPALVQAWGLSGLDDPACSLLLESFLPGFEVDIDCVIHAGRVAFVSISDNFPPHPGTLLESGGHCPSLLPNIAQQGLLQLVHDLADMCGDQLSGVFHVEAMWTPHGAVPIEFNTRMGGAETFTMVQSVWGVDLAREALQIALGDMRPVCAAETPLRHAHSVNFLPSSWRGLGVLSRNVVPRELARDTALAGAEMYHEPGSCIALPPAGDAYMGWLAACGQDAAGAEEAAGRLETLIDFEFDPLPAV